VLEELVMTQDALVEGFHFRLDWLSWRELGFRAAAVNISDLSASGAEPLWVPRGAQSPARG
jgi:thiamine-monophosphate kinase